MRLGWAVVAGLSLAGVAGAGEPRAVTIPGPDGLALQAELFLPEGAPRGPAVVGLHGCSGLRRRDGAVTGLYRAWAEVFTARGRAVLLPDSFGSRGQGEQCTVADSAIRPGRERRRDAIAAASWRAGQPFAAPRGETPGGVVVMGWSHGGSTALWTAAFPEEAPIRAYVAMYPGCAAMNRSAGWRSAAPLLLLIGEADDWTPARPCAELAARNRGTVTYVGYPGAYHAFDVPGLALRVREGLTFTANGDHRAHLGTDPAARADALARVPAFLDSLGR